ncbi:MAG: hypothetical protein LBF61_11735 [Azoarcus sp.]|nr:hypothetical protein [Azoarcus sp.]
MIFAILFFAAAAAAGYLKHVFRAPPAAKTSAPTESTPKPLIPGTPEFNRAADAAFEAARVPDTGNTPPIAAFTREEGEALRREIGAAFDANANAILGNRATFPERGRYLTGLVGRAEKLYGDALSPFGACTKSAVAAQFVWQELVGMKIGEMHGKTPRITPNVTGIATFAWGGGDDYGECRNLIDALPH